MAEQECNSAIQQIEENVDNDDVENHHRCVECSRQFSSGSTLYRHMRNVHKMESAFPKRGVVCPLCPEARETLYRDLLHLEKHATDEHDVIFRKENLSFKSEEDLLEWKRTTEKETKSQYVKQCGTKRSGNKETSFYYCNRSGYYTPEGNNKRHLKSQGTNKINANCPSRIRVVKLTNDNEDMYEVEYVSTHLGHKQELGHIWLSKEEKEWIASLILKGVDTNNVLNQVRDSLHGHADRIHLLTRQDINNIKAAYTTTVKNSNDYISVESWIYQMQEGNSSLVLLYKPQGVLNSEFHQLKEEFFLALMNDSQLYMLQVYGQKCITMDSTHGMNSYGFDLTTLLVLDDMHSGFPVSFLFSSHADERTLQIWLTLVKEKAGTITAKCLMTDDAEAYFNAWRKVMGNVNHRLLCSWHVDQSWRRNLPKITNKEKQVFVYKIIRTLMQETDKEAFDKMLKNAEELMSSDGETVEFGKYFQTYYSHRPEMWAFAYRIGTGVNTNMHLESMHKVIKYIYLRGKKVKRLDKTIQALMNFLRDKSYDRLITLCKGKVNRKIKDIRKNHKKSEELGEDLVTVCGEGMWLVNSETVPGQVYTVNFNNIADCSCSLRCQPCSQTCIHMYSCTCIDYSIRWNMCKHIHLVCKSKISSAQRDCQMVAQLGSATPSDMDNFLPDNLCIEEVHQEQCDEFRKHVDLLTKQNGEGYSPDNLKQEILKDLETISLKVSQEKSVDLLKEIRAIVKPVLSTVNVITKEKMYGEFPSSSTDCREPANKNIEPQRFFPVNKKRQANKLSLQKPTANEQEIAIQLSIS